ncbi:glycosyltransferase family 39 protein [Geminocystis sp. NIES-3709]|uniref:ArnT family glycosyltransferase n=1 Tax=Geminocystis sp. NIES-3709 TaxID=1617448 RepID=UPI0005FC7CCB|nr:glycosyltransferase family 39 protein [Geminocystis sp. NIES-3709]BAQ66141.1 hypothetical protein GM3709_2906 [Geminocystis sp. NIES-3709]
MTYNLARVLLFQQEKSLFLTEVSLESQAIFPVGSDILHHSFLRFYTDYGIGIFSFIAYLIISFGTYSLARRYASQEHSLIATLVIASLPELVLQSTSTKNDILTASVALFCFILAYRLLTNINVEDLVLLPISLSFGISCKTIFIAFTLPFVIIFSYLLIKEYSWQYLLKTIIKYKDFFLVSILPIFVFLPLFTFYHNYNHFGSWNGSEEFADLHKQTDGIKGTLGNLVRYIFQSIDSLEPLELTSKYVTEKILDHEAYTITDYLMKFYNNTFHLIFGHSGIMKSPLFPLISNNDGIPFFILRAMTEDISWFGILGFILVIPCIIYGVFQRDLFLKAVSINLISYSLILCNQLAWQPWANRFFSLFFGTSGVLIAYLFTNIKLNKFLGKLITLISIFTLIYVATFNNPKPLLKEPFEVTNLTDFNPLHWTKSIREKSIWSKTNLGKNRTFYFDIHGFPPVNILSKYIVDNSKVALITTHDTWIYQYLFYNPNFKIIPFSYKDINLVDKINNIYNIDYIFCLDVDNNCQNLGNNNEVLWRSEKGKKGVIFQFLGIVGQKN